MESYQLSELCGEGVNADEDLNRVVEIISEFELNENILLQGYSNNNASKRNNAEGLEGRSNDDNIGDGQGLQGQHDQQDPQGEQGEQGEQGQGDEHVMDYEKDMLLDHDSFYVHFGGFRNIKIKRTLKSSFNGGTVSEAIYKISFKAHLLNRPLVSIMGAIESAISTIIDRLNANYNPQDLVSVFIMAPNLHTPHTLGLQPLAELSLKGVLELIENILQSDESLELVDGFEFHVAVAKNPIGGTLGRGAHIFSDDKSECDLNRNRSIVKITSNDSLCFARSVVVSMAKNVCNEMVKSAGKTSLAYKKAYTRYKTLTKRSSGVQAREAMKIHTAAGFGRGQPIALTDVKYFEAALKVRITIFATHIQNRVIYSGGKKNHERIYLLYLHPSLTGTKIGHFHPIVGLNAFLRCGFFCPTCDEIIKIRKRKHSCFSHCTLCLRDYCIFNRTESLVCQECNRLSRSKECFREHIKKNTCSKEKKCLKCHKIYIVEDGVPHVCGAWMCLSCNRMVHDRPHMCHMRAKDPKPLGYNYLIADFEAIPDDVRHTPNLVIAHWTCFWCIDTPYRKQKKCQHCGSPCIKCKNLISKLPRGHDEREVCSKSPDCGLRRASFFGEGCETRFCDFVFNDSFTNYSVIFHNFQGYDSYFLMNYICQHGFSPLVLYRGSKILAANTRGRLQIRLIDSLNFLQMPLAAMPGVFGLENIKKGNFPYLFNRPENYGYVGPYPEPAYYGVDEMKPGARKAFLLWHSKQKDKVFNFMDELISYCEDDVSILEESVLAFRQYVIDMTGKSQPVVAEGGEAIITTKAVDPLQYTTSASVCMATFRHLFLPEVYDIATECGQKLKGTLICGEWVEFVNSNLDKVPVGSVKVQKSEFVSTPIAKEPAGGYNAMDTHSVESIMWLNYESHKRGIKIQHARTLEGEFKVPNPNGSHMRPLRVDGFSKSTDGCSQGLIYEYLGCLYHGCELCFNYNTPEHLSDSVLERYPLHPHSKLSMLELNRLTKQRGKYLRSLGYEVITMKECVFKTMLANDSDLIAFAKANPIVDRLSPRDALFGGRTNATRLFAGKELTPGYEIAYGDITSLYPSVLKSEEFPSGNPEIIIMPQTCDISQYFGIIFCKVKPPRKMYHPVLPTKTAGKKLIFALCRSCAENSSTKPCSCEDKQRYLVGTWCTVELHNAIRHGYEIIEIYEVFNFKERISNLFVGYINKFLQAKQQNSGFPEPDMTESEKDKYIQDYYEVEGILLDKDKICKNSQARKINKTLLNSLWGKFGQILDRETRQIVNSDEDFYKILTDPNIVLKAMHVLAPNSLQMEYKCKKKAVPECDYVNVFIAAFTTAHARTRLFKELYKLGKNVVYYDTDSIFYLYDPERPIHVNYGNYLGQWTNELNRGDSIISFVSSGPKSYSFLTKLGEKCLKIKGFTLNHSTCKTLHYENMKALVLNFVHPEIHKLPPEFENCNFLVAQYPHKIGRDRLNFKLYAKTLVKKFRVTYGKRLVLTDHSYDTIPFGY